MDTSKEFIVDERQERFVLACAQKSNDTNSTDWVEGFRGHEGIRVPPPTAIEHCILSRFVTIDANQIVHLTEAGEARLGDIDAGNRS